MKYPDNLQEFFARIDVDFNGYIYPDNLMQFLWKHHIHLSRIDMCLLFKRFDRDGNGKIAYEEFLEELEPYLKTKFLYL